jgi:hypothetical protein
MKGGNHLQVLQVFVEQVVQVSEEVLSLLLPPPIPKEEKSFWISLLPQDAQETSFSFPTEARDSK